MRGRACKCFTCRVRASAGQEYASQVKASTPAVAMATTNLMSPLLSRHASARSALPHPANEQREGRRRDHDIEREQSVGPVADGRESRHQQEKPEASQRDVENDLARSLAGHCAIVLPVGLV